MDLLKDLSLKELQDKRKELETEIEMLDQEVIGRPKIKSMRSEEWDSIHRALNRLWDVAEYFSPKTMGNFIISKKNYFIFYDHEGEKFKLKVNFFSRSSILPYFLSASVAENFISENEADLRTVFRVKSKK